MEHVVLLKLKPEALSKLKPLQDAVKDTVNIPGVEAVVLEKTFTDERSRGYTHVLLVRLSSIEALKVYQLHPLHQRVLKELGLVLDSRQENAVCAVDIDSKNTTYSLGFASRATSNSYALPMLITIGSLFMIGLFLTRNKE